MKAKYDNYFLFHAIFLLNELIYERIQEIIMDPPQTPFAISQTFHP